MQHPTQVIINVDNKFLGHYYWRVVIIRISCHYLLYIPTFRPAFITKDYYKYTMQRPSIHIYLES